MEHLHDINKARALFATHYHELTYLSNDMDRLENSTVAVKEWEGEVVFLHEVKKGAADRSYGCLLYTSPSPRDATLSRMPSSA